MTQETQQKQRDLRTERQIQRELGLLPLVLELPSGEAALGWWDAKEYVETHGFNVEIDAMWRVCPRNTPGAEQREIDGRLQWSDGFFPKGMLIEGSAGIVAVEPVFGRLWSQWVYPVEDLLAGMYAAGGQHGE